MRQGAEPAPVVEQVRGRSGPPGPGSLAEICAPIEELINDLIVFLGLTRTCRVDESAAGPKHRGCLLQQPQLRLRQSGETLLVPPPFEVRIAPDHAQDPSTGRRGAPRRTPAGRAGSGRRQPGARGRCALPRRPRFEPAGRPGGRERRWRREAPCPPCRRPAPWSCRLAMRRRRGSARSGRAFTIAATSWDASSWTKNEPSPAKGGQQRVAARHDQARPPRSVPARR